MRLGSYAYYAGTHASQPLARGLRDVIKGLAQAAGLRSRVRKLEEGGLRLLSSAASKLSVEESHLGLESCQGQSARR